MAASAWWMGGGMEDPVAVPTVVVVEVTAVGGAVEAVFTDVDVVPSPPVEVASCAPPTTPSGVIVLIAGVVPPEV